MQIARLKHIHFVGIKGVGMTSLALCAQDLGMRVTGSDVEEVFVTDPVLEKRNIKWKKGFNKENLKPLPDLVITTGAHGGLKNPEVVAARKEKIPVMTHAEGLGFFAKGKKTMAVGGVGGKTTISSMMAVILETAAKHPSFAIGVGEIFPIGYPGKYDKAGKYFICEADEYAVSPGVDNRPRFSLLNPEVLVITNVEHDHPDIYPSLKETKKTFKEFFEKIPKSGLLVADFDNQNTREVIKGVNGPIQTFGFSPGADWHIGEVKMKSRKSSFTLIGKSGTKVVLTLRVPGRYNLKNAAAAFVVSRFLGLRIEQIQKGLYEFAGSKRRFEEVGRLEKGALIYDDYAHHPTQIKSVLSAAKEWFPKKRLIALFQPHTYTRTKALFDQFAKSFGQADIALFMDIYASAREFKDKSVSSKALAEETGKYRKESHYVGDHQGAINWLKKHTSPEDLILTLGAGDIFYIHEKLKKALGKKIKTNESLGEHTTLKMGGPVKLYLEAESEKELKEGVDLAKTYNLPFFVIGEGSNLLVHERGYKGLVIRNKVTGIKAKGKRLWVKAGTNLQDLVDFLIEKGLAGMQKMAGIPGTVGGAIYGNAGAYGQTISDHLVRVKVFDGQKTKWIPKSECGFGYRDSLFKRGDLVLLEAEFSFEKGSKLNLRKQANKILELRLKKYYPDLLCPGSFFKNIPALSLSAKQLEKIPKEKIVYGKVPAGYLLEAVGAKGARLGQIKIADYHANLFVNLGGGKAGDFYKLAEKYKKKVKEKFGIELEPEVQLVGFKKKMAVLGFGIEGRDLVKFFLKKDVDITIFDQKEEKELNFKGIDRKKIKLITGKNYLSGELGNFDIIFRSPGVYRYLPELIKAEEKGVEIFSAIKLFFDLCPGKVIGVTGTKGKGTTATLIYRILKSAGKDVYLAGNIGKPYLELLAKLKKSSWIVLELSSFQLIDMDKSPHIAIVLNITVDHLDWHKDREEYVKAKKNIVKHQKQTDLAVVNKDYATPREFAKNIKARVVFFSKRTLESKFKKDLLLRGEHNLENVSAAISVARTLKITEAKILPVLSKFKGLEHRLELVGKTGGVSFYNDSFATGPQPTMAAIKSFEEPTTVILGGSEKGLDYSGLGKVMAKKDSVKGVILIGQVAPKIKRALAKAGFQGKVLGLGKSKMDVIVKKAFGQTPKGGVVLLSPAAASFDMFENYKDRGEQFKEAVKTLN